MCQKESSLSFFYLKNSTKRSPKRVCIIITFNFDRVIEVNFFSEATPFRNRHQKIQMMIFLSSSQDILSVLLHHFMAHKWILRITSLAIQALSPLLLWKLPSERKCKNLSWILWSHNCFSCRNHRVRKERGGNVVLFPG